MSVTPTEIESYLRQTQFAQTIKALRKDFPDMIRHWRKLSIDLVPVRLGSVTALFVDSCVRQGGVLTSPLMGVA